MSAVRWARRSWAAWAPWMLLALAGGVAVAGSPPATALARAFFLATVCVAIVGGARLVSWRTGTVAAGTLLALVAIQRAFDRPVPEPPSSQWTQALTGPEQALRHTIRLPLGSVRWRGWWARASGAAVYVCARGPLSPADALELNLDGARVGFVTQDQAFGPRPQPDSVGFYRLPVTLAALEQAPDAVLELRRTVAATGAATRPIDVCGTFTYRPTAGLEASAFFDGREWRSPGPTKSGRFVIELRIETEPGKPLVALY